MDCHLDTFFYVFFSSPDGVIKLPWQKWIIDYQGIQPKNVRTERKTAKLGEEGIMVYRSVKEALPTMKMWFGFNKQHPRKSLLVPGLHSTTAVRINFIWRYAYIAGNKRCDENIYGTLLAVLCMLVAQLCPGELHHIALQRMHVNIHGMFKTLNVHLGWRMGSIQFCDCDCDKTLTKTFIKRS